RGAPATGRGAPLRCLYLHFKVAPLDANTQLGLAGGAAVKRSSTHWPPTAVGTSSTSVAVTGTSAGVAAYVPFFPFTPNLMAPATSGSTFTLTLSMPCVAVPGLLYVQTVCDALTLHPVLLVASYAPPGTVASRSVVPVTPFSRMRTPRSRRSSVGAGGTVACPLNQSLSPPPPPPTLLPPRFSFPAA